MTRFYLKEDKFEGLTPEDIENLNKRGYELVQTLGRGNTRKTYLAKFRSDELEQNRVVKIPVSEVGTSVCTLINASKRDVNRNEVLVSNPISHPNITNILDTFDLNEKKVIVEEDVDAQDLESLVNSAGSLSEESFFSIFNGIVNGVSYLFFEGLLHRDIKPSNVLVNKRLDIVKLTDRQNTGRINEISDLVLPTRGGSPYTHPDLLEAPVTEKPTHASVRTEIYSIGATMFYALTGNDIFSYKLELDKDGKSIKIGDKTIKISLTSKGKKVDEISREEHEKLLSEEVKKLPRKFRNIIYKSLTLDEDQYANLQDLKKDLEKAEDGLLKRIGKTVLDTFKPAAIAATIVGALASGITYVALHPPEPRTPTLADALLKEDYRKLSLEDLTENERDYVVDSLIPYMRNVKENFPKSKEKTQEPYDGFFEAMVTFGYDIHKTDKRLVSAWLRAVYLTDKEKLDQDFKKDRTSTIYVPERFVITRFGNEKNLDYIKEKEHLSTEVAYGIMHLKQCIGKKEDVADIYASYFSSEEEIKRAMVETQSTRYFLREVGGKTEFGYGHKLRNKDLINTAVAVYLLTDSEGNIDLNKIDGFDYPERQFVRAARKVYARHDE